MWLDSLKKKLLPVLGSRPAINKPVTPFPRLSVLSSPSSTLSQFESSPSIQTQSSTPSTAGSRPDFLTNLKNSLASLKTTATAGLKAGLDSGLIGLGGPSALSKNLDQQVGNQVSRFTFNTALGKKVAGSVAELTSDIPLKITAALQSGGVSSEYKNAFAALKAGAYDPNAGTVQKFLTNLQNAGGQTGLGVALSFIPYAGKPLASTYWSLISANEQIKESGDVTSLTNIGIDVLGDRILGNSLEGLFKQPVKTLKKTIFKSGFTEGGTEVLQTFFKYANDYRTADSAEQRAQILDKAKDYIISGDILMEFAVGGTAGAGIGATGFAINKAAEKYRGSTPQEKQAGFARFLSGPSENKPEEPTPSANFKLKENAGIFRAKEGGQVFEPVAEKNTLPIEIKKGLETFVVKDDTGYSVIDGKTGQQIGQTAKNSDQALAAAKLFLQNLPEAELAKLLDESPKSPRYEVDKNAPSELKKYDSAGEFLRARYLELNKEADTLVARKKDLMEGEETPEAVREVEQIDARLQQIKKEKLNPKKLTVLYKKTVGPSPTAKPKTFPSGEKENAPNRGGRGTKDINQLNRMLDREKQSLASYEENPEAHIKAYGPGKVEKYKARIKELTQRIQEAAPVKTLLKRAQSLKTPSRTGPISEIDSYQILADQENESGFFLTTSEKEEEMIVDNLTNIFAALKGVSIEDLQTKFTDEDLEQAQTHYELAAEAVLNHPGRPFIKYVSKKTGRLPEVTGRTEKNTSEWGIRGDDIAKELGAVDSNQAQEFVDAYIDLKKEVADIQENFRTIRSEIMLAKQSNKFVSSNKDRLARATARNLKAMSSIIAAANRAGFKEGIKVGQEKLDALVSKLKSRRSSITAIKEAYNLTDAEMKKIRGNEDPRFMTTAEFDTYLSSLDTKAEAQHKKNEEKILIDALINEKSLKKTENLQRALEYPPIKDMTLEQLLNFGNILAKTESGDTFLSPRLIQTAANTDLGNIRTIEEGRAKVAEQTGMPYAAVEGSKLNQWLTDSTLVEKDPLHKIIVTEWTVREVEMLTKKHLLSQEINKLAKASRKSRIKQNKILRKKGELKQSMTERVLGRLAQQDTYPVQYSQTPPSGLAALENKMTPEEIAYGKFLRKFFEKYYSFAVEDTANRWTLRGVKNSRFKDMYFPHMTQGFFERWLDLSKEKVKTEVFERTSPKVTEAQSIDDIAHQQRISAVENFMESADQSKQIVREAKAPIDGKPRGVLKGFRKAIKVVFDQAIKVVFDQALEDSRIDYNAFGDRGEVLGYEKWLKNNMKREGDGAFTQNAAKVAMSYFTSFERKILADSMIPKIKLMEFLLGKRFQTPKSINNPEGTEQVHSQLTKNLNEWINNKKGQRIKMIYEQGDQAEAYVNAVSLLVSVLDLGGNLATQMVSGVGGELMTFRGAKFKGWAKGHRRALTKQGRAINRKYSGVVGENPWAEFSSQANSIGNTLVSALFQGFADLSFRSRRQMFLGLLTKEEFISGEVSPVRQAEIKLKIGRFHHLPEFRSVAGSTSLLKAASKYTSWATPMFQTALQDLSKLIAEMKLVSNQPDKLKTLMNSKYFKETVYTILTGIGGYVLGQIIFQPDKDDKSLLGRMRYKAANEAGSIIQAITGIGVFFNMRIVGFLQDLADASASLAKLEQYEKASNGHEIGDLKAIPKFANVLTPNLIKQFQSKETTKKTSALPRRKKRARPERRKAPTRRSR